MQAQTINYYGLEITSFYQPKRTMTAQVISIVAEYYGLYPFQIKTAGKSRRYSRPRHIVFYLLKTLTNKSYPEIARDCGGFDHTSVMYGFKRIRSMVKRDHKLRREIAELMRVLTNS